MNQSQGSSAPVNQIGNCAKEIEKSFRFSFLWIYSRIWVKDNLTTLFRFIYDVADMSLFVLDIQSSNTWNSAWWLLLLGPGGTES